MRLMDVVAQFLDQCDPIPTIIAENIDGLDKVRDGDSTVLDGSPLLLQVNK